MMSEVSNRYASTISGKFSGLTISGNFTVPAGCYFKGQITFSNYIGSGYVAVEVRDSSGNPACTIGSNSALGTGYTNTQTQQVILDEGTYSVVTLQGSSGTSIILGYHGICFRK